MITRDNELNMDFGLNVLFDGGKYRLVMAQSNDEYPIGGLICEYMRLAPTDIKLIILACDGLEKAVTTDNYPEVFLQFHKKVNQEFPPVISTMIALEFMNSADDWFKAVRENRIDEYMNALDNNSYDSVKEFIFEGTGCEEFGGDTVLQILLTSYYAFAEKYALTKAMFNQLMESDDNDDEAHARGIEMFAAMYGEHMDMQHIDYRLILTENGFESLYTIKSSFSLLIFDMAHIVNTDAKIGKCKNCGHYFVPEGRSDSVYCSYPLRDNKDKTCKDVGAQVTRANKEKNDAATREYRKVYMRCKMATNRHPDDKAAADRFKRLTEEVQEWRNKMADGSASTEEFLEWLKQF